GHAYRAGRVGLRAKRVLAMVYPAGDSTDRTRPARTGGDAPGVRAAAAAGDPGRAGRDAPGDAAAVVRAHVPGCLDCADLPHPLARPVRPLPGAPDAAAGDLPGPGPVASPD